MRRNFESVTFDFCAAAFFLGQLQFFNSFIEKMLPDESLTKGAL